MRYVLHSVIVAEHEADYESTHARVPDDLATALRRVGIEDWTIHRVGRDLIHVIDADDLPRSFAALDGDPANERWQAIIGPFVERFDPADATGGGVAIEPLWTLSTQLDSAAP